MLSRHLLAEQPERVRAGLRRRGRAADEALLDQWFSLNARRRATATTFDKGEPSDAVGRVVARRELRALDAELATLALQLPNLPDDAVPDGVTAAANRELRRWGQPPTFEFAPLTHDALGAALGVLDPARATKLSGPRFPLLIGVGARLSRALVSFFLQLAHDRGYVEMAPPLLLRAEALQGSGHLPHFARDLYHLADEGLYLSPTAEAQLVSMYAGETLTPTDVPRLLTACTPAFRREAGSSGTAMRGLLRQHQFDKVELVQIVAPETADQSFEQLVTNCEAPLQRLGLPYRVVALCAGELPFSAQRTIDLEVWLAGEGRYVEIASVSECGAFQARRLGLRYRPAGGGRARFPATLNGSALPIGRTLAALLEHGQRADGSVALPEALADYLPERELRVATRSS